MYTETDYKSKKALKEAVANGEKVRLFAPGIGKPLDNGWETVSGPHYPKPHTFYAEVFMKDGFVVKVKLPRIAGKR